MTNKKNTISINESQLRDMIAESVKKVLSELDWKTYANAAKKANKKFNSYGKKYSKDFSDKEYSKRFHQGNDFEDAAENAFNKEYGYNRDDATKDRYGMQKNGLSLHVDPKYKGAISTFMQKGGDERREEYDTWPDLHVVGYTWPESHNDSDSDYQCSPQAVSARDRGNQEVKDYMAGNYKYKKGKGWQLKETVEKAVNNVINELLNKKQ